MWLHLYDFQLHEIEMEIQRKKDALKEDDRRRRNLARQVGVAYVCEWKSFVWVCSKVAIIVST